MKLLITRLRYIERNPLRARIVRGFRKYSWSSYRVYGYGKEDGLLSREGAVLDTGQPTRTIKQADY